MDNYQYAFDYIKKSNVPSIKTSKNCGFKKIGELDKIGIFHTLTEVNNGEYEIYRYTNGNSELKVR
jgi:RimJ/RimL family protein N-acetyltransferase